jgi:hypothetical protein
MRKTVVITCAILALAACSFAAAARDWQTGTLAETEKIEVPTGSTRTSNTDGTFKDNGNKTKYSGTTTTHTSEDTDTFQVYTIHGAHKTYVAREKLLFPWSKPANITVGENVKYVIDKNKMIILDDDGKEHKAGITKVSVNSSHPNSSQSH